MVLLGAVLCFFVTQLVVNLDLIFGHLDIFLYDADLLLFLRTLEAEVHFVSLAIVVATCRDRAGRSFAHGGGRPGSFRFLLLGSKLIELFIRLEVNFVLLVELDVERDDISNLS